MIVVYHTAGERPGAISYTITTPAIDPEDNLAWTFLPDYELPGDIECCMVLGDHVTTRPAVTAVLDRDTIRADGEDEAVLSGLPVPCVVTINGEAVTVEDGELRLTADEPDIYRIVVDSWPWLPAEYTVEAVDGGVV